MDEAKRDPFWAYAGAFGAAWGAIEITLGNFLHALHIPFAGVLLSGVGAAWLISLRAIFPRRGVILAAGLVCAGIELVSPGTQVFGPALGITTETLLVELSCLAFGANWISAPIGGALATTWALLQKVLVGILVYGAPFFDLYKELLKRAEGWLGFAPSGGMTVAGILAGIVASIGMGFGLFGYAVGRAAKRDPMMAELTAPPPVPSETASAQESKRQKPRDPLGKIEGATVLFSGAVFLAGLAMVKPLFHAPMTLVLVLLLALLVPSALSHLGKIWRWAIAAAMLIGLGAWLGNHDSTFYGIGHPEIGYSREGALSGVTMISRSVGIVLLMSGIIAVLPRDRLAKIFRRNVFGRLVQTIAAGALVVPRLGTEAREAMKTARGIHPGILRAVPRLFAVAKFMVLRATVIADELDRID